MLGKEITQLVNTTQQAGFKSVQWGCYRQHGQACECRSLPLPDTGRRVCADQEDGAVEVAPPLCKKVGSG